MSNNDAKCTWHLSLRAPHKARRNGYDGQGQSGVEQKVVERPPIANVTHRNNPGRHARG